MRFLFSAYCVRSPTGHSLIGVYKRTLRIGLELVARGHQVVICCPGRDLYRDGLVERAERSMDFVDFPLDVLFEPDISKKRAAYRAAYEKYGVDAVIVGEAPLAGGLLDSTVSAVEARIPVVILDNAYSPLLVDWFTSNHGPVCDGLLLTGPSSFHSTNAPAHVCQVPPFVSYEPGAADELLRSFALGDQHIVTVLGYEVKAELLALSLMAKLPEPLPAFVFLTCDADTCRARIGQLEPSRARRAHVASPPAETTLFDLMARSQLTIGKCGFMQVTESLSLHTPFIGVFYRGCFKVHVVPECGARYVHATTVCDADADTMAAAQRFLNVSKSELKEVHDGSFQAARRAADFIEALPKRARRVAPAELARNGYDPALIESVLRACVPGDGFAIEDVRCTLLRRTKDSVVHSIVGNVRLGDEAKSVALRGRFFRDDSSFDEGLSEAERPESPREVVFRSKQHRFFAEHDRGESHLPARKG
jgi:hypothetical protein